MTTKEKLVWRLGKLPTIEELRDLVKDKIVTNDEAREILFSQETEKERDTESLKKEIAFLKELVDTLSKNDRGAVTQIVYPARWQTQPWLSFYTNYTPGRNYVLSSTTTANNFNVLN